MPFYGSCIQFSGMYVYIIIDAKTKKKKTEAFEQYNNCSCAVQMLGLAPRIIYPTRDLVFKSQVCMHIICIYK